MEALLHYWPLLAFIVSLFISGLGIAIGLTMWIMGKLIEQDAKRIEMKEAILTEVRDRSHALYGRLDQQYSIIDEKVDDLRDRVTRVEATIDNALNGR